MERRKIGKTSTISSAVREWYAALGLAIAALVINFHFLRFLPSVDRLRRRFELNSDIEMALAEYFEGPLDWYRGRRFGDVCIEIAQTGELIESFGDSTWGRHIDYLAHKHGTEAFFSKLRQSLNTRGLELIEFPHSTGSMRPGIRAREEEKTKFCRKHRLTVERIEEIARSRDPWFDNAVDMRKK